MKKFLANILFIFLGLPMALSALLLISVRPYALDRETYKRIVADDRLYTALQAPEAASQAPAEIKLMSATLDGPALVSAVQKNLPIAEIKSTASLAVDTILDGVEGLKPIAGMQLDLKPLKAALKSRSPAAARDYLAALAADGSGAQGGGAAPTSAELSLVFGKAVDAMPDAAKAPISVASRPRLGGPIGVLSAGPALNGVGITQALLNRMTATTAAMSVLLLAGLGALGGSGLVSRLSRAGRYLFLPSLVFLVGGALLSIPSGLIFQNLLAPSLQGLASGAAGSLIWAYFASAFGPIATSFFITGLVGVSLGGVLTQTKRMIEPKELE